MGKSSCWAVTLGPGHPLREQLSLNPMSHLRNIPAAHIPSCARGPGDGMMQADMKCFFSPSLEKLLRHHEWVFVQPSGYLSTTAKLQSWGQPCPYPKAQNPGCTLASFLSGGPVLLPAPSPSHSRPNWSLGSLVLFSLLNPSE